MAESTTSKSKKKKALYFGLGIIALGALIWWLMCRRNITINIINYNLNNYAPLTDAQVKAKIENANRTISQIGVDKAIKEFQNEIDSLMASGSPEALATAKLLGDIILDLQNQNKSLITSQSSTMNNGSMAVNTSRSLSNSDINTTNYRLLSNDMIKTAIDGTNLMLSQTSLDEAIRLLNEQARQSFNTNTPLGNEMGLLINDIIRFLGGVALYTPNVLTTTINTNPTPTPSTNDLTSFVDPVSKPTPPTNTTIVTNPTQTPSTNDLTSFVDPVTKPIVTTTPSRTIATCNYFSYGSRRGGSTGLFVGSEGNSIKISLVDGGAYRYVLLGVFNSIGQELVAGKKYFIRIDYNVQTATPWSSGFIQLGATTDTGSQLISLGLQNSGVPIIVEGTFTSSNIYLKLGTGLRGEAINGNIYITISEFLECVSEPLFVSPVTINSVVTTPITTTPTPTPAPTPTKNDLTSFVDPTIRI